MNGKVYLVGAGPGDPDLLTRKAWRLLEAADVVLHDDLVSTDILALAPPYAHVFSVGKRCGRPSITQEEINGLMVSCARSGLVVVRLKGGDPDIFGRLGEEIEALREAAIDVEIVPGVTAGCAAAASAGIPLTDRRFASELVFVTGHRAPGVCAEQDGWNLSPHTTVVIYMPGSDFRALAERLCEAGLSPDTPCLIVASVSRPHEQRQLTTLKRLPQAWLKATPSVLIVGAVAALGRPSAKEFEEEACAAIPGGAD